jgi:hypothetical protein
MVEVRGVGGVTPPAPIPYAADIERRHDGFSSTSDICFILLIQANASIRRAGGMEKNAGRAGWSHHSSFLLPR